MMEPSPVPALLPSGRPPAWQDRLLRSPAWLFVLYVSLSSFVVYACMYGFRKPFTADQIKEKLVGILDQVVRV